MIQIFIGDNELDLFPNTVIPVSLKSFDIGNIISRYGNFSQQVQIPVTDNNKTLLGLVGGAKSASIIPYQKNSARFFIEGVQLFPESHLIVQGSSTQIAIQVFAGIYDFFQKISGELLTGLDFSSLNQEWGNGEQISASSSTTGLVSPVIQYGQFEYNNVLPGNIGPGIKTIFNPPSIYYHSVVDRIFTEANINKSGTIFTDTKYLKMIIPFSKKKWNYNEAFNLARTSIANVSTQQVEVSPSDITVDLLDEEFDGSENYYNNTTSTYTVSESGYTGTIFMFMNVIITLEIDVSGGDVDIKLFKNGSNAFPVTTLTDGHSDIIKINAFDINVGTRGNLSVNSFLTGQHNDAFKLVVDTNSGTPTVTIDSGRIEYIVTHSYGHPDLELDVTLDIIPEGIFKFDLIKDFIVRHGLVFKQTGNNIVASSFEEIIDNKSNAIDWTDKRDISIDDKIGYSPSMSQSNKFTYGSSDDLTEDDTGQGSIDISNTLLNLEEDLFGSIFSSTHTNADVFGYECAEIPMYALADEKINYGQIGANIKQNTPPGVRVLLVRNKRGGEDTIEYYDINPTTGTDNVVSNQKVAYFVDSVESDSMDFQQFIDDNYSKLEQSLQKYKMVTRKYNLSTYDVISYDPHKPIYDNNEYFLVNEIKNFIPGQLTEVELLKIV